MKIEKGRIELFEHKNGELGYRYRSLNTNIIWTTEGYRNKTFAQRSAKEWAKKLGCKFFVMGKKNNTKICDYRLKK